MAGGQSQCKAKTFAVARGHPVEVEGPGCIVAVLIEGCAVQRAWGRDASWGQSPRDAADRPAKGTDLLGSLCGYKPGSGDSGHRNNQGRHATACGQSPERKAGKG
jgi:hypothetical protein